MCFLFQVLQFLSMKRKWKFYLKRKELAHVGLDPFERVETGFINNKINRVKQMFIENKWKSLVSGLARTGTFRHFLIMAIFGLLLGNALSFIHFYILRYLEDASLVWCFLVRLPVLVTATVLFAFSPRARCFILLIPLQMFSFAGKNYMNAQAMILIMSGPVVNLQHNLHVIQESSACQQRGVAAAAAEIADILFGPFSSFKQAALEIVNGIKAMVEKLQNILSAFKRTVMAVAGAIQDATLWINSKINGCKTSVGTTYQHCMEAFSWMHDECKVSVPSIFVKMCSVTDFASNLCSSVKPGEYLCDLVYFTVDPLVTTIHQRISRLWDRAYTLMYFKVDIHHEYSLDSNSKGIANILKEKIAGLFENINFALGFSIVLDIFFKLYLLWSIYSYYSLYLRREEFDNYFITEEMREIDITETERGEESIFPLRRIETRKFIKLFSIFLVKKEKKMYVYSIIDLFKTAVFILIMLLDYTLHVITNKCRLFMLATMQSFGTRTEIKIEGSGFISELSRRVVRALNFMDYNFYYTHFMPCVPNPKPPNMWIYKQIAFWTSLMWISLIFQPYFLRFRHVIMDWYFHDRKVKRARWLYNKIRFRRITFLSLIRSKLRAKYSNGPKTVSVADMLRARFPWITRIIGKGLMAEECMICNHIKPPLFRCPTDKCVAIYCDDCYVNILGVCCLCKQAMMHPEMQGARFRRQTKEAVVDQSQGNDEEQELDAFRVFDDKEEYQFEFCDYSYQAKIATNPKSAQKNYNNLKSEFLDESSSENYEKNITETKVYISCEDEINSRKRDHSNFKYRPVKQYSALKQKLNYEETFEMH